MNTVYHASQGPNFPVNNGTVRPIYSTTNYSHFRLNPANRPINDAQIDKLEKAVKSKNLLHYFPIVVTSDMMVLDGQHRLSVAEMLDVPIFYTVSTGDMQIEDVAKANADTAGWKSTDYLHYYCSLGNPEYVKFREFWDLYPWLTISGALLLLATGGPANVSFTEFKKGTFVAKNIDRATEVAEHALDFKPYADFYSYRAFCSALATVMRIPEYNPQVMRDRLSWASPRLYQCPTRDDYIIMLIDLYNYKTRADNRLDYITGVRMSGRK